MPARDENAEHVAVIAAAIYAMLGVVRRTQRRAGRRNTNIATSKHDERTKHCGLLDALAYFGISPSRNRTTEEKDYWRQLFINDGPWTPSLQAGGLDYCADDVLDTEQLFYRVLRTVSLPEAFNRGRFMAAAAKVEHVGIPIYMPTYVR